MTDHAQRAAELPRWKLQTQEGSMWILVVIIIQSDAGWIHPKALTVPYYGFQTESACVNAQRALEQAKQYVDQTVFYRCQREISR